MFNNIRVSIATCIAAFIFSPITVVAQTASTHAPPLLMAAGSLRSAMNDMMLAYRKQGGDQFIAQYGPSGKLRKEIEAGKLVDVFASADTKHTLALAKSKLLRSSHDFTHNALCVIAQPAVGLNEKNLIDKLTHPAVRVATSTPVSDPMGDYTWQFFHKADKQKKGAYQALDKKALKLSGASAPKPGEKLPYVTAFENNRADVYVMYCTNAVTTKKSLPKLHIVRIPDAMNVRSTYGISAHPTSSEGEKFVRFVLSRRGQQILHKCGFN